MLNLGQFEELLHRRTLAQCFVHDKLTLTGRINQHFQKLFLGLLMEILCKAKTVTADFQAADCLLESFLVGLTDTHDLAYGSHLSTQLVLRILEFFKCPTGKLNYHIISAGYILIQCTVYAAGNLIQGKSRSKHCGNQSNGKTGCLGSQCGGA